MTDLDRHGIIAVIDDMGPASPPKVFQNVRRTQAATALLDLLDEHDRYRQQIEDLTDTIAAFEAVWEEVRSVCALHGNVPLSSAVIDRALCKARRGERSPEQPILNHATERTTP